MAAEVEGRELDVTDRELLGRWRRGLAAADAARTRSELTGVQRRREDGDAVVLGRALAACGGGAGRGGGTAGGATHLEHVQQRRLAGVVEAEEQHLCVLVRQAQGRENVPDCCISAMRPRARAGPRTPVDHPHGGCGCCSCGERKLAVGKLLGDLLDR